MAIFTSYDMKGQKLSFANWISNLSPTETPFVSMVGKESVDQVRFSWQTDRLSKPVANAQKEGEAAGDSTLSATTEHENFTQILRKIVRVTDSTKAIGLYGRGSELNYQMEKAGMELKRDLEHMFLNNGVGYIGDGSVQARHTSGFTALCSALDEADADTGAVVHFETAAPAIAEDDIWKMAYQLYLVGSKADTIMLHPEHDVFEGLVSLPSGKRMRLFENLDAKFNSYVREVTSPLGQKFTIVYNRYMPTDKAFFFSASDWTQMVLRAPEKVELAKTGSATKYMIEMEVGLRHRNPFASGVLQVKASPRVATLSADLVTGEGNVPAAKKATKAAAK